MSDVDFQCEYEFVREYFGHLSDRRCLNPGLLNLYHGRRLCSRHLDLALTELFICSKCNLYCADNYWKNHNGVCRDCVDRLDLVPDRWSEHTILNRCDRCEQLGNPKHITSRCHCFWATNSRGYYYHNGIYCRNCWKSLKAKFKRIDKKSQDVAESRSLIRQIKEQLRVNSNQDNGPVARVSSQDDALHQRGQH